MTAWASFISDELEYSIFDSRGEFNERHSSNDEICLQVDHGDVFDSGNRNEVADPSLEIRVANLINLMEN